jgi:hypothetical protein
MSKTVRQRLCAAAAVGVAVATSALTLGATAAFAGTNGGTPPIENNSCDSTSCGTVGTNFTYAGRFNPSTVQAIRSSGSDTTFFMMQSLSSLYNQAGLYGGALASDDSTIENTSSSDDANTDDIDNFSRTEVQTGVDEVGSGAGLAQLCGANLSGTSLAALPAGFRIDFARSSTEPVAKASADSNCTTSVSSNGLGLTGMGYAADGVPSLDFPTVIPGSYGAYMQCTAADTNCSGEPSADGYTGYLAPGATSGSFTAGSNGADLLGPVAAGWLPGDSVNGPYTGTAFTNLTNTTSSGLSPAGDDNGVAYRIWCESDGAANGQITDWGQLTNLAGGKTVGNGQAIGVPVQVWGVNPSSGTESVFDTYINKGKTGTYQSCSTTNTDTPAGAAHGVGNASDVALENNAANLAQLAAADNGLISGVSGSNRYGLSGVAGQAAELSAGLYYMSFGVTQTNNYATSTPISGVNIPAQVMKQNGVTDSATINLHNLFPTSRILYNAYLAASVRASTANFLNWIADDNNVFTKNIDPNTGANYDSEITAIIQNQYGFARLPDNSTAPIVATGDGDALIASVSTSLDPTSIENITGTEVDSMHFTVTPVSTNDALNVPVGALVEGPNVPTGDTVAAYSSGTLTLTAPLTASESAAVTLTIPGGLQYNQE